MRRWSVVAAMLALLIAAFVPTSASAACLADCNTNTNTVTNTANPVNTNVNTNVNAPTFTNKPEFENKNTNINVNTIEKGAVQNYNTDVNVNSQHQGQIQGQKQIQGQGQLQGQNQFGYVNVEVDAAPNKFSRQFLQVPEVVPLQPPLISGGVTDVTKEMPNIGCKPYAGEEIQAVKVEDGTAFTSVRLQEVVQEYIDLWNKVRNDLGWDPAFIRCTVYSRNSSSGFGVGSSIQGGGSFLNGGAGTASMVSGSILPSWARSTADPRFTLFAYYLKGAPAKKAEAPAASPAAASTATGGPAWSGAGYSTGPSTVPPPKVPIKQ